MPQCLKLRVGDCLSLVSSGGHIISGEDVLEVIGPFLGTVLGIDGRVLAPMGFPNRILFLARRPGRAVIEWVDGEPLRNPTMLQGSIQVES